MNSHRGARGGWGPPATTASLGARGLFPSIPIPISTVVFSPCAAKESLHGGGDWLAKNASLISMLIFTPLLPICRDLPADVQSQPRRDAASPALPRSPRPKVPPMRLPAGLGPGGRLASVGWPGLAAAHTVMEVAVSPGGDGMPGLGAL